MGTKPAGRGKADDRWGRVCDELRERGFTVEPGLSEQEIRDVEYRFGFHVPPDLRALLQTGLPIGDGFPDWRDGDEGELRERLDWPREGIAFDIERNAFWNPEWGSRPAELAEAIRVAGRLVAAAPKLIPVYSHRMIPDDPRREGNPVFSVYQTDIIIYGRDLLDYFRREFRTVAEWWTPPLDPRPVRFWNVDGLPAAGWPAEPRLFGDG